jgi:membrane-associated phospholipid phosphatase
MPSGHTTATMAFAVGVLLATRGWPAGRRAALAVPLLSSALLVAVGRVLSNQHWLSDVLVALLLGSAVAVALAAVHRRWAPTRYDRMLLGKSAFAAALLFAMSAIPAPALAQRESATHGPVFTKPDALTLGLSIAAGAVVVGWDRAIADQVRSPGVRDAAALRGVMDGARAFGDPGAILLGGGLWAAGKLRHRRTEELIGLRAVEAIVVSGLVGGAVKGVAGRARPDEAPTRPRSFVLGRGIGDREQFQSFPSGHATAAFAFAAAVHAEWGRLSPRRPRWVGPALWSVAALSAASRVYHDRHWTSDVIVGSAIGYAGGRAVVRWHADQPDPR